MWSLALPEFFYVCGILLFMKVPTPEKNTITMEKFDRTTAKRTKTANLYNRMYNFADLKDPDGKIFVVIDRTKEDNKLHWDNNVAMTGVTVGDVFLFRNPCIDGVLMGGVTILKSRYGFLQVRQPSPQPCTKSLLQTEANRQRYYCLHNAIVTARNPRFIETVCNHYMCDRQHGTSTSPCGCYHNTSRVGNSQQVIVEMELTIQPTPDIREALNDPGFVLTTGTFSSFRTTSLFFQAKELPNLKGLQHESDPRNEILIRQIQTIMHTISIVHGGWTIVGWFRRGTKVDQSTNLVVESDELKQNVVYCMPTHAKKEAFNAVLISDAQLELSCNGENCGKLIVRGDKLRSAYHPIDCGRCRRNKHMFKGREVGHIS